MRFIITIRDIVWRLRGYEPLQLTADPAQFRRGTIVRGYRVTHVVRYPRLRGFWQVWGRRVPLTR